MQCLGEQEVIDLTSDEDEVAVVDAAMRAGTIVGNSGLVRGSWRFLRHLMSADGSLFPKALMIMNNTSWLFSYLSTFSRRPIRSTLSPSPQCVWGGCSSL